MNAVATAPRAGLLTREDGVRRVQAALREMDLDGWLLYEFHGVNRIAVAMLGLGKTTRRSFVLIPAEGEPELHFGKDPRQVVACGEAKILHWLRETRGRFPEQTVAWLEVSGDPEVRYDRLMRAVSGCRKGWPACRVEFKHPARP